MKLLYLHGLESKLSAPKRAFLEQYAEVIAPSIDYRKNATVINHLYHQYRDQNIDLVVGSSMGGFVAYHLSAMLNRPGLLFNPALVRRSLNQEIPQEIPKHESLLHFTLGAADTVVSAQESLQFIAQKLPNKTYFRLQLIADLAHRIPLKVFQNSVHHFFTDLRFTPKKHLFLDDIRDPQHVYPAPLCKDFAVVRSVEAFKQHLLRFGLPEFISFDNDLGLADNGQVALDGYAAAKWLVYESGIDLSELQFAVHSANPIAAEQIQGLLDNYLTFIKNKQKL